MAQRRAHTAACRDRRGRPRGENLAGDYVIQSDVLALAVEDLYRARRTARVGARGRVTSFVTRLIGRLVAAIEGATRGRPDRLECSRAAWEAEAAAKHDRATTARLRRERVAAVATEALGGGP